jgi:hypothetical protein
MSSAVAFSPWNSRRHSAIANVIADVNSENSLSRRHFFADVYKFYDIGKELFIIDGEARLLIILIGKKYILTIVPKTHDVRSKDANFFRCYYLL